jgi:hypothetical protein
MVRPGRQCLSQLQFGQAIAINGEIARLVWEDGAPHLQQPPPELTVRHASEEAPRRLEASFAVAARRARQLGGDDILEEWRSAAACTHGRVRPDGYGCYRRNGSRFGFFLEFDRGTEKPAQYASKLATYDHYRGCTSTLHRNGCVCAPAALHSAS